MLLNILLARKSLQLRFMKSKRACNHGTPPVVFNGKASGRLRPLRIRRFLCCHQIRVNRGEKAGHASACREFRSWLELDFHWARMLVRGESAL